jgi:hypothetical protein
MKVFIINYNLTNLNKYLPDFLKLPTIIKYIIQIYSTEGNMIIDNKNTYKLNYIDKNIIKLEKYFKNYDLVIDNSIITKEITTQVPQNHLAILIKKYIFKLNSQSKIKFVVISNNTNLDKENEIIPIDFYFEFDEELDLHNFFIKEEISEFLSMLN